MLNEVNRHIFIIYAFILEMKCKGNIHTFTSLLKVFLALVLKILVIKNFITSAECKKPHNKPKQNKSQRLKKNVILQNVCALTSSVPSKDSGSTGVQHLQ